MFGRPWFLSRRGVAGNADRADTISLSDWEMPEMGDVADVSDDAFAPPVSFNPSAAGSGAPPVAAAVVAHSDAGTGDIIAEGTALPVEAMFSFSLCVLLWISKCVVAFLVSCFVCEGSG